MAATSKQPAGRKTPTKQRSGTREAAPPFQQQQPQLQQQQVQAGTKNRYPSQELLDDLCSRFVLNVPVEELQSFERILFLIEQAHWFYEDNTREQDTNLKSFNLREFTSLMFQKCASLQPYIGHVDNIYKDFTSYKFQVPTTGAIILNETCSKCLLVKGWKASSSWGFPKGKKNKDEEDHKCAIREVLEETSLDIASMLKPDEYLELVVGQQRSRLFIITGIPESSFFEPQTKKEISEIAWHPLDDIPSVGPSGDSVLYHQARGTSGFKYYLVHPFIGLLKEWLSAHGLKSLPNTSSSQAGGVVTMWKAKSASLLPSEASVFPTPSLSLSAGTALLTSILGTPTGRAHTLAPPVPMTVPVQGSVKESDVLAMVSAAYHQAAPVPLAPADSAGLGRNGSEAPGKSLREFKFDMEGIMQNLYFNPP